jgi:hypothetical protein
MATLTEEHKQYIVQCLACFDTPSQVAEDVSKEFSVTIDRMQVQKYDPTKAAGRNMSPKLQAIFHATREAFLKDIGQIPIASQAFRLRSLQRQHDYYMSRKNYVQAAAVLEQAAKEMGGIYTNRVKVAGDEANPLMVWLQSVSGGSMPIAQDVGDEEGEVIEHDPQPSNQIVPVARPKPQRKKRSFVGRD